MRKVLRKFNLSGKHLWIIDSFLRKHDIEYKKMEEKLKNLGDYYRDFCRELYYGGCRTNPGSNKDVKLGKRQMILSDIIQYITNSRSYYFSTKSDENKKQFIKILFYIINQWMIMDCFSPKETKYLRQNLIDELKTKIGTDFFENSDSYHIDNLNEIYDYDEDIIVKPPNTQYPGGRILSTYDSLFPKIRGGTNELLIYIYLLQRKLGFIVSLLTQQRFLSGGRDIAPPDLFLLRKKGEVIGLEIGRGKERQSADFSLVTGIPTFSIDLMEDQPFRCDSCGRWIIYCDGIIEDYSENGIPEGHNHIKYCVDCQYFNNGNCPDIIYFPPNQQRAYKVRNRYNNELRRYRNHFRCIPNTLRNTILNDLDEHREFLISYFPLVDGLEDFPEEPDIL